jgi:signal transduction histidine kinase
VGFIPRLGLAIGIFLLWAVIFLSLTNTSLVLANGLVAVPVFLSAILFGVRGAVIGSLVGAVSYSLLYSITGAGSLSVLANGNAPVNTAVLFFMSVLVGYGRLLQRPDASKGKTDSTVDTVEYGNDSAVLRAQLKSIANDFSVNIHNTLDLSEVSKCVAVYVGRALAPDFFAIAVADLENRKISIRQSIGMHLPGFGVDDYRLVSEALKDPMGASEVGVSRADRLEGLKNRSHIATMVVEVGIRSMLSINIREGAELVAQVWIGSGNPYAFSPAEIDFADQITVHVKSAVINARNSESLIDLQQHLVGQNERLALMQDGVENTEAELRLAHLQLRELSDSKTQFMSEVAHEIKTPLSVMIGYADILRYDADNLADEQREFAAAIEKSARQMAVLIDDLSDITNIESGHFTTDKRHHDVIGVWSSVIDGLKVSSDEIERRVVYSGATSGEQVIGDPDRLGQVFTNLITNALKYSPEDAAVEVSYETTDDRIVFAVTDHGLGISEGDIDKLFTAYFRSTNPSALERKGTELGLFLSQSIVEAHGGTINVSSVVGAGTTFSVELPLAGSEIETEAEAA